MNYLHRTSFLSLIFTIVLILSSDFVFAQSIMYEMGSAAEVEYVCGEDALFTAIRIVAFPFALGDLHSNNSGAPP